jgi:HIV-1 Vpr-binding protein
LTLTDSSSANHYWKNVASFNPTDDLVLNDGVLWDVRGKRVIHKFDKFNNFVSGVFHPSGLEIIINSEVVSLVLFPQETIFL